jgi:hypothetical protein
VCSLSTIFLLQRIFHSNFPYVALDGDNPYNLLLIRVGAEMAGYASIRRLAIAALVALLAAIFYQATTLQWYAFKYFTFI